MRAVQYADEMTTDPPADPSDPPEPRVDRPGIPADYGAADASEFVAWSTVERRLDTARVFWIATVGAAGRPRVRPIDGLYLDRTLYVGGSPETRWVQEVTANPHVAIHLDGIDDVLILDGVATVLGSVDAALAERLATASNAKFPAYHMTAAVYRARGAIAVRLRKVVAWTDITRDPTRFILDGD